MEKSWDQEHWLAHQDVMNDQGKTVPQRIGSQTSSVLASLRNPEHQFLPLRGRSWGFNLLAKPPMETATKSHHPQTIPQPDQSQQHMASVHGHGQYLGAPQSSKEPQSILPTRLRFPRCPAPPESVETSSCVPSLPAIQTRNPQELDTDADA